MSKILPLFLLLSVNLFAQTVDNQSIETQEKYPAKLSFGQKIAEIPPLRDDAAPVSDVKTKSKMVERKNWFGHNKHVNPKSLPGTEGDALVLKNKQKPVSSPAPSPIFPGLNFEGIRDPSVFPPDPTGDIGKDHYCQATNRLSGGGGQGSWFQVWDKNGNSVLGPVRTRDKFWGAVGGTSIGDPIVQYDHHVQRWLFMEMRDFGTSELLIAISKTADPTGNWTAYRFQTDGFPDYPKLYVWPDAYYITVNEIVDGNKASGYALEKAAMVAGEEEFKIYRFEMPTFLGIQYQPATGVDWEGGAAPPPGSPGMVMRMFDDSWSNSEADHLQIWKIFVNWQNQASSFLQGPEKLYVTPFESTVCWDYFLDCIEQPGGPNTPRISAQDQIILYRIPYRNYGNYESMVLTHIVDVSGEVGNGGDAATRWYELRRPAGSQNWQIAQEGTYAPDEVNRFMGTMSMDINGNIGFGYTVCDEETFPGIRLTGHRTSDAPGELADEEFSVVEGGQSHSTLRWGDYSNMAVDPTDGRTFWFTAEYQPAGAAWGSRITSFTLRRDTFDARPKSLAEPQASPFLGTAEKVTVQISNEGLEPAENVKVTLKFEGQFVAQEAVVGSIPPGQSVLHTFVPTVSMNVPGKTYIFDLITEYDLDQYDLNDSIRTEVQKLTSNDASASGRINIGGTVCSSEHTMSLLLRNAAAVPLTSTEVHYQVNTNPYTVFNWSGNLLPGKTDTVDLPLANIKNGLNFVNLHTKNPNGNADEDIHNDSLTFRFTGILSGQPMRIEALAFQGQLQWDIRDAVSNQLIATGKVSSSFNPPTNLCLAEGKCYRVVLKGLPNEWIGNFELYDMFDSLLVRRTFVSSTENIEFCTPTRKNADVGPLKLLSPSSSPGLSAAEKIMVSVRNYGKDPQTGVKIRYRVDGGNWTEETLPGTLQSGETQTHAFAATGDFSTIGKYYAFDIETDLTADEAPANNAIHPKVFNVPDRDLSLEKMDINRACASLDDIEIVYRVRNNGSQAIDSFAVVGKFAASAQEFKHTATAILAPGSTLDLTYYVSAPAFGQQDFSLEIQDVNGLGKDQTAINDLRSSQTTLNPNGFPVYLLLSLDTKPQETRWEVLDDQGLVVLNGGPYLIEDQFISTTFCLENDKCYTLKLYDSGNDGMQGTLWLGNAAGTIFEFTGGNFGNLQETPFCNDLPCAGLTGTFDVVNASSETATDGGFTIHPTGGTPPYWFSLDQAFYQSDSVFTGKKAGTYLVYLLDAANCETILFVEVSSPIAAHEPVFSRKLSVSPNPANAFVQVKLPARPAEREATCDVFDEKGQFLFATRLARWDGELSGVFSLEKFPAGAYFLRVKGEGLDRVFVGQVLKN